MTTFKREHCVYNTEKMKKLFPDYKMHDQGIDFCLKTKKFYGFEKVELVFSMRYIKNQKYMFLTDVGYKGASRSIGLKLEQKIKLDGRVHFYMEATKAIVDFKESRIYVDGNTVIVFKEKQNEQHEWLLEIDEKIKNEQTKINVYYDEKNKKIMYQGEKINQWLDLLMQGKEKEFKKESMHYQAFLPMKTLIQEVQYTDGEYYLAHAYDYEKYGQFNLFEVGKNYGENAKINVAKHFVYSTYKYESYSQAKYDVEKQTKKERKENFKIHSEKILNDNKVDYQIGDYVSNITPYGNSVIGEVVEKNEEERMVSIKAFNEKPYDEKPVEMKDSHLFKVNVEKTNEEAMMVAEIFAVDVLAVKGRIEGKLFCEDIYGKIVLMKEKPKEKVELITKEDFDYIKAYSLEESDIQKYKKETECMSLSYKKEVVFKLLKLNESLSGKMEYSQINQQENNARKIAALFEKLKHIFKKRIIFGVM